MLIFEILGLVSFIISEIIIFFNMGDKNEDYYDNRNWRRGRRKYSRSEWADVVVPITAADIALALNAVFTDF